MCWFLLCLFLLCGLFRKKNTWIFALVSCGIGIVGFVILTIGARYEDTAAIYIGAIMLLWGLLVGFGTIDCLISPDTESSNIDI